MSKDQDKLFEAYARTLPPHRLREALALARVSHGLAVSETERLNKQIEIAQHVLDEKLTS